MVKSVIQEMLTEAGVRFLFAAQVVGAETEGSRLTGVHVQKKSGGETLRADVFVDATGDAELAYQAGAAVQLGAEDAGVMQPPTLLFRLENVDITALRSYLKAHPDDFVNWRLKPGAQITPQFLDRVPIFLAFPRLLDEARRNGDYEATIDRVMFSVFPGQRGICVNMLRPFGVDGTRSESITDGLMQIRSDVLRLERFFRKYIPGCADAYAVDADPELLFRETRRIRGEYALTADDVLAGRQFPDSIGLGAYYIDYHNPANAGSACLFSEGTYGIPYRCLLPQGVDGLLVAGRAISGTTQAAGSFRVMAICMAIGEAAGTAAAIAAATGAAPRAISVQELRRRLLAARCLIDWNAGAPTD